MRDILDIAESNKGFVTTADVTAAGIQRRELARAVSEGLIFRIGRGIYCLPETWEDEYVIAQHRFSRGVFSHETALYLLDLSDRMPERLTMTFPQGYNTSGVSAEDLIPRTVAGELLDLGKTRLKTPYGNEVIAYDVERSLCDLFRGCAFPDVQILNPAMKSYLFRKGRNIPKLLEYARMLGVEKRVRMHVEVLL